MDVKLGLTPGFELMTFEILCNYSLANWCVNCWKCKIRRIRSLWHFTPTLARNAWTGPLNTRRQLVAGGDRWGFASREVERRSESPGFVTA